MVYQIGVDIGKKRDPTAICVAGLEHRDRGHDYEIHYIVRYLDRLPLGTPYPDVVRRVGRVADGVARRTGEAPRIYVDATGVGTPVVDLLRDGTPYAASVIAVYFTHGDRRTQEQAGQYFQIKLGKAFLVSRLQALLQTNRIHLPSSPEAKALAAELLVYEIRVDENANDRYGAFRVGTHDDLVTALGLAVHSEPACSIY